MENILDWKDQKPIGWDDILEPIPRLMSTEDHVAKVTDVFKRLSKEVLNASDGVMVLYVQCPTTQHLRIENLEWCSKINDAFGIYTVYIRVYHTWFSYAVEIRSEMGRRYARTMYKLKMELELALNNKIVEDPAPSLRRMQRMINSLEQK